MKKKYFLILIVFIYINNYSQIQHNVNKKVDKENNQIKIQKSEEIYFKKGITNYKLKNYKHALYYFSKSIKLNSKEYTYYYWRGCCYLEKRETKKSIIDFNKAIEINPNDSNTFCKLGFANYIENDSKNSISNYNKSLKLNPYNSNTYYYQSLDLNLTMQYPEKKEKLLTKAIDFANSIEFHSSFENIAEAYFYRGMTRKRILASLKLSNVHNNSFNERKYLMEQMLDYTSAIKCNSKYSDAYYERGLLKNKKLLNDSRGAYEDFSKAIKTNPSNGNAYIERGYLKLNLYNDGNGAIDDLIKSTKLDTDFLHPKEITYTAIGIGYVELGKKIEGCKYLSKAGELGYEEAFNYINIYCK